MQDEVCHRPKSIKFRGIEITFCDNIESYYKSFNPIGNTLNYKHVDMFYEVRKNKNNLIKFWVQCASLVQFDTNVHGFYLWERKLGGFNYIQFIGPKAEEKDLIEKMESVCKIEVQYMLSYKKLGENDYVSSKFLSFE